MIVISAKGSTKVAITLKVGTDTNRNDIKKAFYVSFAEAYIYKVISDIANSKGHAAEPCLPFLSAILILVLHKAVYCAGFSKLSRNYDYEKLEKKLEHILGYINIIFIK